MVIEDGLTLESRRENPLPNKPLQRTGGLRRRAARHYRTRLPLQAPGSRDTVTAAQLRPRSPAAE